MSQVTAVSYTQKQCGRHVSDTKKRFAWIFEIDGKSYTFELINSTLSGKRTVMLNMEQIYHQKNILNIDFDFTHMISGHSFRISRTEDRINGFQMRIDNRTFDQVKLGRHRSDRPRQSKQYAKTTSDPFAEFGNFGSFQTKQTKNNVFGDFDFDSFSKPITPVTSKVQQTKAPYTQPQNLFDLSQPPASNQFQTTNNFSNFISSFKQNQTNLLDINQNEFSTNTYVNRNHFMDLNTNQSKSNQYGVVVEDDKDKNIWNNFGEYNRNAGLATKKAINNAAMSFNQMKKDAKGFVESLI